MQAPLLTNLEMQTLQAMCDVTTHSTTPWMYDQIVYHAGRKDFGIEWGGREELTVGAITYYPTINATFGRLRRKGMAERMSSSEKWGYWRLTSQARDLLGLPPTLD